MLIPFPGLVARTATGSDADKLNDLFARCTADTRRHRFHGPVQGIPPAYLEELLAGEPDRHDAIVVEVAVPTPWQEVGLEYDRGTLIALGSGRQLSGRPLDSTFELGLLVEDRWQRRGLGSALLRMLAARAKARGATTLRAQMMAEDKWLLPVLRRHCGAVSVAWEQDVLTADVTLELAGAIMPSRSALRHLTEPHLYRPPGARETSMAAEPLT